MGEPIDGKTAADWGFVNESLPLGELRSRVTEVAAILRAKNPVALKATEDAIRRVGVMTYDEAEDYLVRARLPTPSTMTAAGKAFASSSTKNPTSRV